MPFACSELYDRLANKAGAKLIYVRAETAESEVDVCCARGASGAPKMIVRAALNVEQREVCTIEGKWPFALWL